MMKRQASLDQPLTQIQHLQSNRKQLTQEAAEAAGQQDNVVRHSGKVSE
jgi:hypothetical protein